jgi:thioredoxin reductase
MPTVFAVGDVRAVEHATHLSDAIADGQRAAQSVVSALKKS